MAALAGPLVLVGCGKMGSALLHGWLSCGLAGADALVVEPDAAIRERVRAQHGVAAVAEAKMLPLGLQPRAVVFAIKPQTMAAALPAYQMLVAHGAVVLSIAAGRPSAASRRLSGRTPRSCAPCRTRRRPSDRASRRCSPIRTSAQRSRALLGADGRGGRSALDR